MLKRLVIRTLYLLFLAGAAFAEGTVTQSLQQLGGPQGLSWALVFHVTGDATTGHVPVTAAQIGQAGILQGYFVTSVEVRPRTPAPTSGYGLTLTDAAGVDILSGAAASLSATAPQAFSASTSLPPINGTFLLTVAGQNVAGAKTDVFVYITAPEIVHGDGATGPAGAVGSPGTDGLSILNGTGVPSSGLGVNGDFYLDTSATRLYGPKSAGAWGSGVLLIGPTGATGATGAAGTNGLSVLNGSGAPSGGTGVNGDFYIDTVASAIYGPKSAGSWGSPTSLIGPQGPPGSVITLGPLQFLQGKPNVLTPTQQAADLPYFLVSDFDFPAQAPGGTLTATVLSTATLAPCPLGVAGADVSHYYRIAGGTGTAETVVGQGGTCTSGASSGTLMFTPLYSHSGAWTITSDSGGLREAVLYAGAGTTIRLDANRTILVGANPGVVIDQDNLSLIGSGWTSIVKSRDGAQANQTISATHCAGCLFDNFALDGNRSGGGTNPTFGDTLALYGGGTSHTTVSRMEIFHSAGAGIVIGDTNVDIQVSDCYIHDNGGVTDATGNGVGIFVYWSTALNEKANGIRILGNYISHNHNTITNAGPSSAIAAQAANVIIDGNYILDNYNNGGQVVISSSPAPVGPAVISNNTIIFESTGLSNTTAGIESDSYQVTITGNTILNHTQGASIALEGNGGSPGTVGAANNVITGNMISTSAGLGNIALLNGGGIVRATTISGNRLQVVSSAGIFVDTAAVGTIITGNNMADTSVGVNDTSTDGANVYGNYPASANSPYAGTIASASSISMRCGQAATISGSTTVNTISLPTSWAGANLNGCSVTLIVASGASWATGTSGNISVALPSATPGTSIILVSDGSKFNPIAAGASATLPTATPLQYLRADEYTSQYTSLPFPFTLSADYNYAPQQPGGTISIGSNTKTLTPCPLGLSGSDVNHSIYISGGTGTAEAILIAGGTCTSGAASGTVVFTAANTHSGAYTISSASAGIEEAANTLPSTGGTVIIPADSNIVMRREVIIAKANVTLLGQGMDATIIVRGFATSPSSVFHMTGQNDWVKNLTMNGNDVCPYPCTGEIELEGDYSGVDGVRVRNQDDAAVHIHGDNNTVRNCQLIGLANSSVTHGFMGIYTDLPDTVDGLFIYNNIIQDQTLNGIFTLGKNIQITSNYFSGNHRQTTPTGGGQIDIKDDATAINNLIADNVFGAGGNTATTGIEEDSRNTRVSGNVLSSQGAWGITISNNSGTAGSTYVDVVNNTINNSGSDGIVVAAGVTDWSIVGNRIKGSGGWGVNILAGASDKYSITGNDLTGNTSGTITNNGTGANRVISGNLPAAANGVPFASLGAADDGTILYCPDCQIANPCAGGGTGAWAKRLSATWVCN